MAAPKDLVILRHSAAHILAQAISELFPETLLTIGPATPEGFFYDFLPVGRNFKEDDLAAIETRMHEISKRALAITHEQISKEEARNLYKHNSFKLELIDQIPGDTVGLARQGDFYDLCKGGHVANTKEVAHFKILSISGSYWRADRSNQQLQRISGTAFYSAQDLAAYEQLKEDALRYDHRRLGKQLDLFSFHDVGVGFPFFHPKGKLVLNLMTEYLRSLLVPAGYLEIATPAMLNESLWKQSGHYAHFQKNMFFCTIEDATYALKPMNCPGSIIVYQDRLRSYRELPLRLAEFGQVHRFELSGVLHGLFRVREFTQDDGHIYCTPEQIEIEVTTVIDMIYKVFSKFGFTSIDVKLSTRPDNAMGSDELWEAATTALSNALNKSKIPFTLCEGEGAFYGPKIEFHIQDSMNRTWQCGTVQVDFFMPENFDLSYVASTGERKRPVIVHRAIYGSFERFFGILLEHYKGVLPFWISPVQAIILPITDDQKLYAEQIVTTLAKAGVRVEMDQSSDPLTGKIKAAQVAKIPWMLIVGKKEMDLGTVTLRNFDGKQEFNLSLQDIIQKVQALT